MDSMASSRGSPTSFPQGKELIMGRSTRTQLALGVVLVLLGGWFLAVRSFPDLERSIGRFGEFPLNLVTIGALLLVMGLVLGTPGMAVPASIVAGIGGIFYYQELMNDQDSWSYMWALIPGFVGVGSILAGLLGENTRHNLQRGLNLMAISSVLFLVFSSFLGGWDLLGNFVPALVLIMLGVWLLGSTTGRLT
jgi:hypothetical protein